MQGRGSGAGPCAPPAGRAGNRRGFERSWAAAARPHPHPGSASISVPRLPNTEKLQGAQSHRDLHGGWWTLGRCCLKRTSDGASPAGSCVALSCWAEQHLCPDPLPPPGQWSLLRDPHRLSVRVTPGSPAGPGERVRALHPEARVTASCHLPLSALMPVELLLHRQREGGRVDPPPPAKARDPREGVLGSKALLQDSMRCHLGVLVKSPRQGPPALLSSSPGRPRRSAVLSSFH